MANFDFVAGRLHVHEVLHLEKIPTVSHLDKVLHEWALGAWLRSVMCSCVVD
jgi:hypothetical protein